MQESLISVSLCKGKNSGDHSALYCPTAHARVPTSYFAGKIQEGGFKSNNYQEISRQIDEDRQYV